MKERFMDEALKLALEAEKEGEVPVGAVVVCGGKIVGKGRNRREASQNALAHAEIEAINEACSKIGYWRLNESDLYVTLEPCPMCAGAAINARIRNVYAGVPDPKGGATGSVTDLFEMPFNHKPCLFFGMREKECKDILQRFFTKLR